MIIFFFSKAPEIEFLTVKTNGDDTTAKIDDNGDISIEICDVKTGTCCATGNLDNPDKNDFEVGQSDQFRGQQLGDCQGFRTHDIGSVTVKHSGQDNWIGDFVKIDLTNTTVSFTCTGSNGLIELNNDEELTLTCQMDF